MNTKITVLSVAGFLLFIGLAFLAWEISEDRGFFFDQKIKIVVSLPLGLESSRSMKNAIELAFEQADYKAGKFDLELVVLDDSSEDGSWSPELEENNARIAANDTAVMAYIGPANTGAAKVSMPILNKAGIVQISPSNTWPGLTKPGFSPGEPGIFYPTGIRHYFRVIGSDDMQGPAGVLWARELGFQSVYILDDGESYGKGLANLFKERAELLDLSVLNHETIDRTATAFPEIVTRIKDENPDLVYFGGATANGVTYLVREMREAGIRSAFMGPDGIHGQEFIDRVGEFAEGVYVTALGARAEELGTERAKEFAEAYQNRFGIPPEIFGNFAYEATNVIFEAIQRADKKDRAKILQEVRSTRKFQGVFPAWSFDENGDTDSSVVSGSLIRNGEFEFVKVLAIP